MAEDLNGYFSSVFTREGISSVSVPDAKFQDAKSDYLGQLIVTPKMVAKKIIPPKLLMETIEQISIPLATSVQLVIKRGSFPLEWKQANIIPLFKKGSRNK